MSSAATTTNLGLPQWAETEKPERTDFNTAFSNIDAEFWKYVYPVGSLYETTDEAFVPGTHFGGTWESYGAGKVIIGVDSGDADFNASGKMGGAKTHTLTVAEMPSHNHDFLLPGAGSLPSLAAATTGNQNPTGVANTYGGVGNKGSGNAHNNLQPYVTAYRWRRTA